ncbi:MAG: preprotein translocase subunit SecE [Candidatus Pacebacteria bacterium]|nr:preprotein translocase subunit SecE [Candidatus Paceibacterota bacterium]
MNIFKKIKSSLTDVKNEAKKVTWPSKKITIKDSFIIIVISLTTAAFLGGVDYVLSLIIENIYTA